MKEGFYKDSGLTNLTAEQSGSSYYCSQCGELKMDGRTHMRVCTMCYSCMFCSSQTISLLIDKSLERK